MSTQRASTSFLNGLTILDLASVGPAILGLLSGLVAEIREFALWETSVRFHGTHRANLRLFQAPCGLTVIQATREFATSLDRGVW